MSYEIEFKLALPDAAAAERLEQLFKALAIPAQAILQQANHFFDTASGKLGLDLCVLRLRIENEERHVLTAKGATHSPSCEGATVQLECEAEIPAELSASILVGAACPLASLRDAYEDKETELLVRLAALCDEEPLIECGEFSNLRKTFGPWQPASGPPLLLELDRTDFGKRTDYELEVEVSREQAVDARTALEQLLTDTQIEWQVATSKARRFFELNR